MIHILHIIDNINIGGGQRIILDIIKNSNKKEFEMSIFCYESKEVDNHFIDEIKKHNINIIYLKKKTPSIFDFKKILRQADVIHIHACFSIKLMICIFFFKRPVLFSIHCNALLQAAELGASITNIFVRFLLRLIPNRVTKNIKTIMKELESNGKTSDNGIAIYKKSKLYSNFKSKSGINHLIIGSKLLYILFNKNRIIPIPISISVMQSIYSLYGLSCNTDYVYNGIDIEQFAQNQKTNYKIQEPVRIINVARFSQWKNHELLIDAFALVLKQINAKLILIGDGSEKLRMIKKTITLGIADSVNFMGIIKDVGKEMSLCDIYVMCSMDEGFGLALTEAMIVGLPVIITNTGGMPEQIIDGQNGIIVEPNNPQILADAIIQLAQSEDERSKVGNKAKTTSKTFNIQKMVEHFCELYNEVNG